MEANAREFITPPRTVAKFPTNRTKDFLPFGIPYPTYVVRYLCILYVRFMAEKVPSLPKVSI